MTEEPTSSPTPPMPFPGADATDLAVEQIVPPQDVPMDDAAGGPQGDAVDQPADDDEPSDEEAAAQLGSLS